MHCVIFKDRYFLVNWLEEDDRNLYDVVHSKAIVPPKEFDILDIRVESICRVSFDGKFYKARVMGYGMHVRACTCVCMRVHVCLCVHVCVYTCVYVCLSMSVCMCVLV